MLAFIPQVPLPLTTESDFAKVSGMKPPWARQISVISAIVFFVSAIFPLAAANVTNTSMFPNWWGAADVTIAFVLAALTLVVLGIGQSLITKQIEELTYRAYRVLIHGIFILLVVFVFYGSHIVWGQCLSGLAWRSWLLLYVLPAWLAVYSKES
ncbi:MAG TPA: hypothetical protein VMU45_06170 [Candidatus Eisenbacteria bacterium]|nr:hypothetical protein [Candidatus Eisenbacteria bacterium]